MERSRKMWTDEDKRFLREHVESLTDTKIATHLQCTLFAVRRQRQKMGLKKQSGRGYCKLDVSPEANTEVGDRVIGVYCIVNKITGMRYIGASTDVKRRLASHRTRLRKNKHYNFKLQSDWNEYGEASFQFYVLATVKTRDREKLHELEHFYFLMLSNNIYNTQVPRKIYR